MESEEFTTTSAFDALNRVVSIVTPDTSEILPTYNEANLLEKVDVKIRGAGTATPFVSNIDYNAKGQRTLIEYSSGDFSTEYTYDPQTFRLVTQRTTRKSDGAKLQDFTLTYDPAGNIVQLSENADQGLYFSGATPVAGGGKYEYDAIYRLVSAEGREQRSSRELSRGGRGPPRRTSCERRLDVLRPWAAPGSGRPPREGDGRRRSRDARGTFGQRDEVVSNAPRANDPLMRGPWGTRPGGRSGREGRWEAP